MDTVRWLRTIQIKYGSAVGPVAASWLLAGAWRRWADCLPPRRAGTALYSTSALALWVSMSITTPASLPVSSKQSHSTHPQLSRCVLCKVPCRSPHSLQRHTVCARNVTASDEIQTSLISDDSHRREGQAGACWLQQQWCMLGRCFAQCLCLHPQASKHLVSVLASSIPSSSV
jgi:hypothetical protein